MPHTLKALSFNGQKSPIVAAGHDLLTDPVKLRVKPSEDLLVSIYVHGTSSKVTEHWDAQQDSFISSTGDFARTQSDQPYVSGLMTCWMFVDRIDILPSTRVKGTVVAFGDSITDGFLSDFNADDRWPNDLGRRLLAHAGPTLSVTDEGIWGNEVLTPTDCCGVSALSRMGRDVSDRYRASKTSSCWRGSTTSAARAPRSRCVLARRQPSPPAM